MQRRIFAISLIWVIVSVAWFVLGGTVLLRTDGSRTSLYDAVGSSWGTTQQQRSPDLLADAPRPRSPKIPLPLVRTRADVGITLDERRKGLIWYSTYQVDFRATYLFHNDRDARHVTFRMPFPASQAIYDDYTIIVNGRALPVGNDGTAANVSFASAAHADVPVTVRYRSRGLDSWSYAFGEKVSSVDDFVLRMKTNFDKIDFPPDTVSPTTEQRTPAGWNIVWDYHHLISGFSVGLTMPQHMQPGPLAQRLAFWAPVSLLFFFVVLFVITTLRSIELHPMNYAFLAAAFFAFHLLFAYSVDHIDIVPAFVICSAVSVFLVISYLRLVVGLRFAAVEAASAQLIYLVLFSLALFNEGWSGLTITVGSIVTLFVLMQLTGRVRWSAIFAVDAPVPRP